MASIDPPCAIPGEGSKPQRLRARQWLCSCGPHPAGAECGLIASLDRDLRRIGGWVPDDPA
jgi:hypothetical protein